MKQSAVPNASSIPLPAARALRKLGRELALARRKRGISTDDMAARAFNNGTTLWRLERGDPAIVSRDSCDCGVCSAVARPPRECRERAGRRDRAMPRRAPAPAGSATIAVAFGVASRFGLKPEEAAAILRECAAAGLNWSRSPKPIAY